MLEIEVEIGRFGPAQVQEQRHTGEAESPATSLRQRRNVSGRLSRNVQDIAGKNFVGVGPFGLKGQVVRMVVDLAPVSETMLLGDRNQRIAALDDVLFGEVRGPEADDETVNSHERLRRKTTDAT